MKLSSFAMVAALAVPAAAAQAAPAPPTPAAADPAPVIAAERAFAASAGQIGIQPSFLAFMAPDAFIFAPDKVAANAFYAAQPTGKPPAAGGTLLAWWPSFAGIARSGDLGFTTGPLTVNGARGVFYFTVWARQPDGAWKWLYDGGFNADARAAPGPEIPPTRLPAGDPTRMAPAQAMAQVKAAEATLALGARSNVSLAYKIALAPDARIQGSGLPPATTPSAADAELLTHAASINFTPIGGGASGAGDLAWTYGDARWTTGRGHYVRIWQRRAGAWRLVFDQMHDVAPPAEEQD